LSKYYKKKGRKKRSKHHTKINKRIHQR